MPQLAVSSLDGSAAGRGNPGSVVNVSGSAFNNSAVEIRWNSSTGAVLATTKGPSFSTNVTVPADASPDQVYYLVALARGANNEIGAKVSQTFEITPGAAQSAGVVAPSAAKAYASPWSTTDAQPSGSSGTSGQAMAGAILLSVGMVTLAAGATVVAVRRRTALAGQ